MGSTGKGRAFAWLVALLLAGLVPVCLLGLVAGPPQSATGDLGDSQQARAALAAWESLWSKLAEHGQAALRPVQMDRSLRASGDTVFMRYRNLWGRIDASARHAFQMAALSADAQRKLALIAPLTTSEDPHVRFRARLKQARIQRRLHDLMAASESARAALAIADIPERIRSDAHFILADIAWENGRLDDAETALSAAIDADPGFWDARQWRLRVLARQLAQPRQSSARCLERTRRMIEDLGALPELAQDQTQLRDVADRLANQGTPGNAALALLSGLGYLWAGDSARAGAALAGAEAWRGRLPATCEALILGKAREWMPSDEEVEPPVARRPAGAQDASGHDAKADRP